MIGDGLIPVIMCMSLLMSLYVFIVSSCCQEGTCIPLSDNEIVASSKLKAFTDDKKNVTQPISFIFERVENIVGKGENAAYQHFLLFPKCFQVAFFFSKRGVNVVNMW